MQKIIVRVYNIVDVYFCKWQFWGESTMKNILLVADEKDPDIKDLISELSDNYKFIIKKDIG